MYWNRIINSLVIALSLCVLLLSPVSLGHGNKSHTPPSVTEEPAVKREKTVPNEQINLSYFQKVRPIFEKKCFDCHSQFTHYPWYHQLPIVRSMIDDDIKEGRSHIDFSHDFPFLGHGSVLEDLDSIKEEIEEGEMPPLKYRIFHPSSKVTESEKLVILKWISDTVGLLNSK